MESQLIGDLVSTIDIKIFNIVLQLIVVGALILWIKDINRNDIVILYYFYYDVYPNVLFFLPWSQDL